MSWIEDYTNKNEEYWFSRIQYLISRNTTTEEGKAHGETDEKWIYELVGELIRSLPPDQNYDGNMRMSALLSYILGLWYSTIHYMKCYNPDRPLAIRQSAYRNLQRWKHAMFESMIDTSKHPAYAPGHPWSHPFDGDSISGDFV